MSGSDRVVAGFRFAGVAAGLRPGGRPDLGLLVGDSDLSVAALFTRNRVRSAPVLVSQERSKAGLARALVVHAGYANALTGRAGLEAAQTITRAIAKGLPADERRVLYAATGRLGAVPPTDAVVERTPELLAAARGSASSTGEGFEDFARAILPGGDAPMIAYAEAGLGRAKARLLACARGPSPIGAGSDEGEDGAATLGVLVTDAAVDGRWLRQALRDEAEATPSALSLGEGAPLGESHASPSDCLFLLASGRAGNAPLDGGERGRSFRAALRDVLEELGQALASDGSAASGARVVTVEVQGATDSKTARLVARRVAASPVVRAALARRDPSWSAVVVAVGNSGVDVDPDRLDVELDEIAIAKAGHPVDDAAVHFAARRVMSRASYALRIHLHRGRAEGRHLLGAVEEAP